MHIEARAFLDSVKLAYPSFFTYVRALDVGGGDINGNNRSYFDITSEYNSNDVTDAPNVTIVGTTASLTFPNGHFDTIISSECFEHDMEYEASLNNIVRMLKPGGMFVFTCASTGRPEHGTLATSPNDAYTTKANLPGWSTYYKNLTADDVCDAISCDNTFMYSFFNNYISHDLYFVGFKVPTKENGEHKYVAPGVTLTKTNFLAQLL